MLGLGAAVVFVSAASTTLVVMTHTGVATVVREAHSAAAAAPAAESLVPIVGGRDAAPLDKTLIGQKSLESK